MQRSLYFITPTMLHSTLSILIELLIPAIQEYVSRIQKGISLDQLHHTFTRRENFTGVLATTKLR